MLFCPYRAGGFPPAEADRCLEAWLSEPKVAKSWQAAILGRRLECDCGLPRCHVEVVEATLPYEPRSLRLRSEWRSESLRKVRQIRQGQQVSHVFLQILESGAGGICEYPRMPQVMLPNPLPLWHGDPPPRVRDLLPLPLPALGDLHEAGTVETSVKNLAAGRSAQRWATLLGAALNYLFVGGPSLLHRPLQQASDLGEATSQALAELGARGKQMTAAARAPLDPSLIMDRATHASADYLEGTTTIAFKVSLAQVEAGLPPVGAGGVVAATRFVDPAKHPWFENPKLALRAPEDWPEKVPRASILCDAQDYEALVARLYKIGIVEAIEEDEIFTVNGEKTLNGLMVVPIGKGTLPSGELLLRLIMNFVPINSYLHEQIGETRSLPNMAQWGHFVVHKDEIVLLYSEDQRASFYLYKLPEAWRPYCVFRWPASGKSLGLPSRRRSYFAARVVPMGFAGSVPIMQDVGQALATAPPPLGAGISLPLVRGDRAFPLALPLGEREVQQIYLDNWDSLLICPESQRLSLDGGREALAGVPSARLGSCWRPSLGRQGADGSGGRADPGCCLR